MGEILFVIPCGKRKIWDKYPEYGHAIADEAYIGTLHKLTKVYAKNYSTNYVILSAKHGLLISNDVIKSNYDVTFQPKFKEKIISTDKLLKQKKEKKLDHFSHIVALMGKKYIPIVNMIFDDVQTIEFPLLGTRGIGEIQQLLKKSIENDIQLHRGEKGDL
ncbi:DUF6884 domain-containing protein [Gracilibacillus marinus]|jgi:hypothetical protein|uniref:DUF6884 domain-containing protein n=1 Tax=Gracilibacillus marinus TaxID=630535 RepID=A0ABV8VW26_9BACI